MKKTIIDRFPISVIIGLLILCGMATCHNNLGPDDKLASAEALVETDPDSARKIILSIDSNEIHSSSVKADYILLDAYSRYKTWQDLPPDSVLAYCTEHYSESNGKRYMISLFLRAYTARKNEFFGKSVAWLTEALDIAQELRDSTWMAHISAALSDNFSDARNIEQYCRYSKSAANLYKAVGKERHALFMLIDYADALSDAGEINRSLRILDSVAAVALKEPIDTTLLDICLNLKYLVEFYNDKREESLKTYRQLKEYVGDGDVSANSEARLADIFVTLGDEENAMLHLKKGNALLNTPVDSGIMHKAWSDYYMMKGEYKKSKIYADSLIKNMNQRFMHLLNESAMSGVGDYYIRKADRQAKKSEQKSKLLIALSAVAVLIIAAGLLLYRYRIKAKNAEIDSKIMNIIHVTELLESKSREADALAGTVERQRNDMKTLEDRLDNAGSTQINREIENLFREKWTLLNMLCKRFYNMDGSRLSKDLLLKDIEGEVAKLTSGTNLKTIEDCVNRYMNGIVDSLREECDFLSPADLKFLTLAFAGFNIDAISMFMRVSRNSAYMRKSRIKTRLSKSDYAHKDAILRRL